jgi:beta-phosphoglucomutase-like phosphatase (HAD superfamily)
VVIFDCNGVLVDSEPIASAVLAEALAFVGVGITPHGVLRRFHGRRAADIYEEVEAATGKKLPAVFSSNVAAETLQRFRSDLRPISHAERLPRRLPTTAFAPASKSPASSSSFPSGCSRRAA